MDITHAKTKAELIKSALENIIKQEKRNQLLLYHGKINLDINLGNLRKR